MVDTPPRFEAFDRSTDLVSVQQIQNSDVQNSREQRENVEILFAKKAEGRVKYSNFGSKAKVVA